MNCAVDAGTYSAAFYGAVGSAGVCLGAFVNQPQDEMRGILVYLWALKNPLHWSYTHIYPLAPQQAIV